MYEEDSQHSVRFDAAAVGSLVLLVRPECDVDLLRDRGRIGPSTALSPSTGFTEGTLLCVISTLTGSERDVTLRADGPC